MAPVAKILIRQLPAHKEQHGNVYPDQRDAPDAGVYGKANDEVLNKMFGQSEASFFNRTANSTYSVATSIFSGLEHFNASPDNDLIAAHISQNPAVRNPEIQRIEALINAQKEIRDSDTSSVEEVRIARENIELYEAQISKIKTNLNDDNEVPPVSDGEGGLIPEEDNFNPDFSENSIKWNYSSAENEASNRSDSQDNVGAGKHPNIAYPMYVIGEDGSIDYSGGDAASGIPMHGLREGNGGFGSDRTDEVSGVPLRHSAKSRAIAKIMNKYVGE